MQSSNILVQSVKIETIDIMLKSLFTPCYLQPLRKRTSSISHGRLAISVQATEVSLFIHEFYQPWQISHQATEVSQISLF